MERIITLFPGRYDNCAQIADERCRDVAEPHSRLSARIDLIDHSDREAFFLVRGYAANAEIPYMARYYSFAEAGLHRAELTVRSFDGNHRFNDEARALSAAAAIRPNEGVGYPGCELTVVVRANTVLCANNPDRCQISGPDGEPFGEEYRLSFNGPKLHILRLKTRLHEGTHIGRRNRVPYKLELVG